MIFTETPLPGAFILDLDSRQDARGFFARTFCQREFESHGLNPRIAQCNISYNSRAGTLRGLHYQHFPASEAKLVRCLRGSIYDVIIDLRLESPTYRRHFSIELSAENRRALYVPESFAHGFQTLSDDCEIAYQMSEFYQPNESAGFCYNDSAFHLSWPLEVTAISEQDLHWPPFCDANSEK